VNEPRGHRGSVARAGMDGTSKLFVAFIVFGMAIGGVLLPMYISKTSPRLLSLLSTMSGGVFLSGGFVHLLPDAQEQLASVADFPLAGLFAAIGFLLILYIEEAAHSLSQGAAWGAGLGSSTHTPLPQGDFPPQVLLEASDEGEVDQNPTSGEGHHTANHKDPGDLQDEGYGHKQPQAGQAVVGYLLLLALSFHSLIEGLGIGANPDPYGAIIAVLAHKALAAYALGTRLIGGGLVDAGSRRRFYAQGVLFACMSPLGVLVGMAVGQGNSTGGGICTALAAGTFLYVAINEVIAHELEDSTDRGLKLICLAVGFTSMSLLALWV